MDLSKVYSKTTKGARAVFSKSKALPSQSMRVLSHIDGRLTLESILTYIAKLTEHKLDEIITKLFNEGYIQETTEDSSLTPSEFEIHTPIEVAEISAEEFQTLAIAEEEDAIAKKERGLKEAQARAKAYAKEQARLEDVLREQEKSEQLLLNAADALAKAADSTGIGMPASKQDISPEAMDLAKSGTGQNDEAIAMELARLQAAQKSQDETVARAEAETRREAEEKARADAERKAREAMDARVKLEAEEQARLTAKRLAREAAEALAKRAAEEKTHAEAERRAREEAEVRAKREAEEKARLEAKHAAREEAKKRARAEAELKARAEAERKALKQAETERITEAKLLAKHEAEEKARIASLRKAREDEEKRAKREGEERARLEAKRLVREAAEARSKIEAEEKARADAARKALKQAEAEKKAELKLQAKREAEEKALAKAEEKDRKRAEKSSVDIYKLLRPVISVARRLLISVSVIVLLLLVLVQLVNLSMLISPIQDLASESAQEPVTIKSIHTSLWPQPHLVLTDVSIGELNGIKASNINVYPILSSIFSPIKTLKSIELEALTLDQDNVTRPIDWVASSNKLGKLKIGQIYLNNASIKTHDFNLPAFNADIKFDNIGNLEKATINNGDHHLSVVIAPENDGYAINLTADNWQTPLGPAVVFDELSARGTASHGQVNLSHVEARLYGGTMTAQLNINWVDLWGTKGNFQLVKINLENIIPIFSEQASFKGRLNATGTFSMKANELSKLIANSEINASFEAIDGYLGRMDLVRAMQVGGNEPAGGGSTRFDRFSGSLALKDGHYQFRRLALQAGPLNAVGEVDIQNNQSISGKIHTELTMKSRQLQSNSTLSGTLGSPLLN